MADHSFPRPFDFMPASEVRRGPASPEEQVASEQVSSLPALWRPGPQALVPLQEVLRGSALAERKQGPGLRGAWLVSTYEFRPLSSNVTHETAARRTRLRLPVIHRGNWRWTGSSGRARSRRPQVDHREGIGGHMRFLASDLMKGRDTASPETRVAAEYLSAHLFAAGAETMGDDGRVAARTSEIPARDRHRSRARNRAHLDSGT